MNQRVLFAASLLALGPLWACSQSAEGKDSGVAEDASLDVRSRDNRTDGSRAEGLSWQDRGGLDNGARSDGASLQDHGVVSPWDGITSEGPVGTLDCAAILKCFKDRGCIVGVSGACEKACLAEGSVAEANKVRALIACEYNAVLNGCQECAAAPDSDTCRACLDVACGAERAACGQ